VTRRRARTRDQLTALGEEPVEGPTPRFALGLEHRLAASAGIAAGATLVALPGRHRSWFPAVTIGAGVVASVVVVGALVGTVGRGGSDVLSLAAAVDTTVMMPGGHTVAGRTGLALPNGSVVWTGPNGSATAGTVDLGPGLEAVVDAGRLRLAPTTGITPAAGQTVTIPAAVPAGVTPPAVSRPAVTTSTSTATTSPTSTTTTTTARHKATTRG